MKGLPVSLLLIFAVSSLQETAFAQIQDSLSVQGYVTDAVGVPINGTVPMTFKLYRNGTTPFWTQSIGSVAVSDGSFNVVLGATPLDTVFNYPTTLGVTVGGDPEISPRITMTAAPYAFALRHLRVVPETAELGPNLIGGSYVNSISADANGSTIAGGGDPEFVPIIGSPLARPNIITADFGFIGGGVFNEIADEYGVVGGGVNNTVDGNAATIGGGQSNEATARFTTIAGGWENMATHQWATVGGGQGNDATGDHTTIGGGFGNIASGLYGTVAGGLANEATEIATTVGGGDNNTASGGYSTVPGGSDNEAVGGYSFAAGVRAKANHNGTFVWADWPIVAGIDFPSSGPNQFLIRAGGGVGIGTSVPDGALDIQDAIEFQTDGLNSGQANTRIFLNEVGQAEDHGFSLAYIGNNSGNATFDSTAFDLAANRFFILRHASSKTGLVGLSMARNDGRTAIGRETADEMLHVFESAGSTGIKLGGDGTDGPHGIVFEDNTADAGVQLFWRTTDNHFVLEKTSAGTGTNGTDVWLYDRDDDTFGMRADFYPLANGVYDLGTSSLKWNTIYATNNVIQTSDRRLKSDINDLRYGLPEVLRLRPVSYRWKERPDEGTKLGLIAQEVQPVVPEVVHAGDSPDDILGMSYTDLVPVLINAIQEQQDHIQELESRLAELERRSLP